MDPQDTSAGQAAIRPSPSPSRYRTRFLIAVIAAVGGSVSVYMGLYTRSDPWRALWGVQENA